MTVEQLADLEEAVIALNEYERAKEANDEKSREIVLAIGMRGFVRTRTVRLF